MNQVTEIRVNIRDEAEEKKINAHVKREVLQSRFQIHQKLEETINNINSEIREKLSCRNIIALTLHNFADESKKSPLMAICKIGFTALCGYGLKNFVEGIFAGERLLANTPFKDLFSSDIDVQNNAGGNITNAVQDVQFARDGIFTIVTMGYVLFRNGYKKAKYEVIEDCFNKVLKDTTLSVEESNELFELKKSKHSESWF